MRDKAWEYCDAILDGRIPSNRFIRGACSRFLEDIRRSNVEPDYPYYYDEDEAERSVAFFERLLLLSGGEHEGEPFILLPWQQFIVRNIYAWKLKKNDLRRFRTAYIETAKGSGKSPLLGGMALKGICADNESRAEGYIIARSSDQALVTFRNCVNMVEQSPILNEHFKALGGVNPWQLTYKKTNFLRRVSSDHKGRHSGPIPHIVIVDEYHEHDSANMRDTYAAGVKNRRQPLILTITNSGVSFQSPCGQEHLYARSVALSQVDDDSYFSLIYGVDEEDDPFNDELCWIKANPSLAIDPADCEKPGVTSIPGYDYIREQVKKAKGMPSKQSIVSRLCFCRWVDAEEPWIEPEAWQKVEVQELSSDEERAKHWAWIGLDLSSKRDLSAGCIVWDMGDWLEIECKVWTPKDTLYQRSEKESRPYQQWADKGYVDATPGAIVDMSFIAKWIIDCLAKYKIGGVAYDPWRIDNLEHSLEEFGIETSRIPGDGILMVPHPQGFVAGVKATLYKDNDQRVFSGWMPRSIEYAELMIYQEKLRVKKNPALSMAVSSTVVIADASFNRRLHKGKSLSKIDPCLAMVIALGTCIEARTNTAWRGIEDISEFFIG